MTEALSNIRDEFLELFLSSGKRGILLSIITIAALFVVKGVVDAPHKSVRLQTGFKAGERRELHDNMEIRLVCHHSNFWRNQP